MSIPFIRNFRRQEWLLALQVPFVVAFHFIVENTYLDEKLLGTYPCMETPWAKEFLLWIVVLLVIGGIYYWLQDYRLSRGLHYLHLASLVVFPVLLYLIVAAVIAPQFMLYTDYLDAKVNCAAGMTFLREYSQYLIVPLLILFAVGQIGFVVNLFLGITRGKIDKI